MRARTHLEFGLSLFALFFLGLALGQPTRLTKVGRPVRHLMFMIMIMFMFMFM